MGKKKEKKVKEKKEKKEPGKKKILFILIPVILVLCAVGGVGTYLFLSDKKPEQYWEKEDKVAPVSEIVGERKYKQKKKDDKVTYTYEEVKDSAADVEKYVKYLKDEKKFVDIEEPEKVEEPEKEAAKEDSKAESKDTKKEKEEEKDVHYELGIDAKEKGKILTLTIDVKKDSYTIKAKTEKGTVAERQEANEKVLKEQEKQEKHNFEDAVAKIQSLSSTQLGTAVPIEQLTFFPYLGRTKVEGEDYFKVMAYSYGDGGTVSYEGSYLVDCRSVDKLYKYNEWTREYTPIK